MDTILNAALSNNIPLSFESKIKCPKSIDDKSTNPYWLNAPFEGLYTVSSPEIVGTPTAATFALAIEEVAELVVLSAVL